MDYETFLRFDGVMEEKDNPLLLGAFNFQDTATFEIYKQNIWSNEIYWDSIRVPKGEQLMNQGLDWMNPAAYMKKSGFDFILLKDGFIIMKYLKVIHASCICIKT